MKVKPAPGRAWLTVSTSWKANCGDPTHADVEYKLGADPTKVMPASFKQPLNSRSKTTPGDFANFIKSGFNVRALGREHIVTVDSCGTPASGTPTAKLSALVTAYPAGQTGLKFAFAGFTAKFGWTEADEYADDYNSIRNDTRATYKRGIKTIKDKNARLGALKPATKAGKKLKKSELYKNSQRVNDLQAKLDAIAKDDESRFSWAIMVFDEELTFEDGKQSLKTIREALATADRAKEVIEKFLSALSTFTKYSPAWVNPTASIEFTVFAAEGFFGFRLASHDSYKGPRWRALPGSVDAEVSCKLLEISGSLGVVIGKRVLGTGASIEILGTFSGSASIGGKYSSPDLVSDGFQELKTAKAEAIGEFRAGGKLSGKASFLYFNLVCVSADITGGAKASTDCPLVDVFDGSSWSKTKLVFEPVRGAAYAHLAWWDEPWAYPYTVWEKDTKHL